MEDPDENLRIDDELCGIEEKLLLSAYWKMLMCVLSARFGLQ